MEGGGEKIVSFSYLVYVIIGLAIGPAIDKLVEYVDIVLSYQETLNSLKAKVEDLTTIIPLLQKQYPSDDIERQGSSAESAVKEWAVKLRRLHGEASAMEQNIARINVVSRYRASNEMKQKISEMEKHLKLFPLIQLELILMSQEVGHPDYMAVQQLATACHLEGHPADVVQKLATVLIKRAAKSILRRMKMVIYFNREVASLKHLVTGITPIVDEFSGIRRLHVYPAIDRWCKKMCELVKEVGKIKSLPWWNVIRRYKGTQDVAYLISTIEAHVKSASLLSLEPLFQELPRKKHRPSEMMDLESDLESTSEQEMMDLESTSQQKKLRLSASVFSLEPRFQEMMDLESSRQQKKLRPSAQVVETLIELDASNDEGLRVA